MKFELHIQSDNPDPGHELARILRNIAGRLERDSVDEYLISAVADVNGNTVGCWELRP